MKRLYYSMIEQHFAEDGLMLFLAGPRQSGKTTTSEMIAESYQSSLYLNWDERDHRQIILAGSSSIAEYGNFHHLSESKFFVIFDELHKYKDWKQFLKGFYDLYKNKTHILVTGSSRLDVFKHGGDSLMGRYFLYRMHPLSVAECITTDLPTNIIRDPSKISDDDFENLYRYGGYPKPFLKSSQTFSNRWQRLRSELLVQEDIRDGTRIQELKQLEVLVEILKNHASQQLNHSGLSKLVGVSIDTIVRWIEVLSSFYYCFLVKPWHKNVTRSLVKEPKIYLWDWSLIKENGAKFENFVASHLLKAVHYWVDMGHGDFDLYYIRTLDKQEVDFLVTKDGRPWFLVEAKYSSNQSLSANLCHFQRQLCVPYAFQVCYDMPYVNKSCFTGEEPIIVPARTFLSQLF
jgi:uncharacterized protein